jgi:tetratricopeptide (TPR) repeat protein
MKEIIKIDTMTARNVYPNESLQFVKKIVEEIYHHPIPTTAKEIHRQDKPQDYMDEFRIYSDNSQGIKYHSHVKILSKKSRQTISKITNETFGFENFYLRFTISSLEGLELEIKSENEDRIQEVKELFEEEYGYCRKQSKDELFDEIIHELRTRGSEKDGQVGIELGLKAIEINPKDFWARFYLGCSYALNGQYKEAIQHLTIATELDTSNHDAFYNLALSYYYLNDFKEAKKQMLKAKELAPNNHSIIYYLARINEQLGDTQEAEKYYQLAIQTAPENNPESKKGLKSYLKEAQAALAELSKKEEK